MEDARYLTETDFVPCDLEDEDEEFLFCGHNERLVISFGLICTSPPTALKIAKNL